MKTLKTTALVLGLFALLAGTTSLVRAQDYPNDYQDDGYSNGANVSMQTFYDELSPYGTWIQDPQYGYVWRPDVDQEEFRPYYTNGRWVMTEYGNTWVSNYDWGWAPFHYGRWVINNYRQWIWLPDTNWGPAWVDWRSGDGYYGWAPMAPSININLSFGRRYSVPEFCWNFIPQANIYVNLFPRYNYGRNNVYFRNTTIINNTYVYNRRSYYGGPRMEDIRRATNRDVRVYRFEQSNRPGASRVGSREVSIYRPRPERNADNRSAAPRKFEQGNAGFNRNGRNEGNIADRNQRGGNNDNRFGSRSENANRPDQRGDNRLTQPNRNDVNADNRRQDQSNRNGAFNRDANGRIERATQNSGDADQRNRQATERSQEQRNQNQQRIQQMQQRNQQDRVSQEQQRAQRDVQMQQQRTQQGDQQRNEQMQRAQQERSAQMEQQRAQRSQQQQQIQQQQQERNQQMQQQRNEQAQQQRTQRDAQLQQRNEQQQQQRQQRMERPAENRVQPPQQQQQNRGGERSSEGGRPTRGGRG